MPHIKRRHFMIAGGASLSMPTSLAIAQSDNRPSITIAVQLISLSNTFDQLREQSNVGDRTVGMFAERLIGLNIPTNLDHIPELATSWKRIDDRTVELSLRKGVKFHNGDEMTAEDVAFSFGPERMFGNTLPNAGSGTFTMTNRTPVPGSKAISPDVPPVARRLWPALDRVEVVDRYTVRFVNASPDLTMEGRIACRGSEIVSKRAYLEADSWLSFARKPIGTGAYKIRSFRPDGMLVLDSHDEYWGGRPPIKTITVVQVPEAASRINGLLSGDFTFACDIPPDQIPTIEKDSRFEVQGGLIANHRITVFDVTDPTLKDPLIRRAMSHSVDRQALVDSLWGGRTRVPPGLQFESFGYMFLKDWTNPEFNPDLARSLLKQAGYRGDPISYRLLNDYYANQTATAQTLAAMWEKVGLNIQIEMKENFRQVWAREGHPGIHDNSNSAQFNDPASSILSSFGPNGQQTQYGNWKSEKMNALSAELLECVDRTRRPEIFREILQHCERDNPAYIVLHQSAAFTGKRKSIPWRASPSYAMDFRPRNWGGAGGG